MDIDEVKKNKWFLFEYVHDCPIWLAWDPFMAYAKYLPQEFGIGVNGGLHMYKNGDLLMCFDKKGFDEAGKKILDKIREGPKYLSDVLDKIENLSHQLFTICSEMREYDYSKYTNKELLKIYNHFFEVYVPVWSYGQLVNILEMNNSLVVGYTKSLIEQSGIVGGDAVEVLSVLSKFEKYGFAQKEEVELIAMAKNGYTKDELNNHCEKYSSIGYGWSGPAWQLDYFKDRLGLIKKDINSYKIKEEGEHEREILDEKEVVIKKYNLKKNLLDYTKLLERIGHLKGLRVDASFFSYQTMEKFLKEVGKRCELSYKQAQFILPDEMREYLDVGSIPDVHHLNERMKLSAFVVDGDSYNEIQGEVVNEFIELVEPEDNRVETDRLEGEVGNPGQAVGIV